MKTVDSNESLWQKQLMELVDEATSGGYLCETLRLDVIKKHKEPLFEKIVATIVNALKTLLPQLCDGSNCTFTNRRGEAA